MNNLLKILCLSILFTTACKKSPTLDDPILPVLSIENIDIEEGNLNTEAEITIRLSGENITNVLVDYSTVASTAIAGVDYQGEVGQLIFSAGENEKTVSITIIGDLVPEPTKTFDFILMNPVNASLENNRASISILDDDSNLSGGLDIPSTGYTTPDNYSGMTLVWADEFDQAVLDETAWTHEIGNGQNGWGNNEEQYYQAENTYLTANDYLVIEAKEDNVHNYTSSRIITQGKKEFKYGRVDVRAAMPRGQGIWPAIWMLGSNFPTTSWPTCGEIDIMEMLGHETNRVYGTVHYGAHPSLHSSSGASRVTPSGNNFDTEFHVFSLIWEEDHIQILVNDVLYFDVTPPDLNNTQPWPYNQEFFFIFNIAVGGNWPGSPDDSTVFSQYMIVDYIRVFQ